MNHPPVFTADIHDWQSWGAIFQSIEAFAPLIACICNREGIEFTTVEQCTPGTNAVFKLGNNIFKIYSPIESGIDSSRDYDTELFGIERAYGLGVSVPKILAKGEIADKYLFRYMIMEHIDGKAFGDVCDHMTAEEKYDFGKALRLLCDKMNTSCEKFNNRDLFGEAPPEATARWQILTPSFHAERLAYLGKLKAAQLPSVYVHADLNPDNILLANKNIYLIDFADAVLAPVCCEYAVVAGELFAFDKSFMSGFFGETSKEEIVEICFNGLLLHDFGAGIIRGNFHDAASFTTLQELRKSLEEKSI
jgi:tRNA A-37 threonylcarbamoyl transferase component Bud32